MHTLDGEAHRCRKDVFLKTVIPAAEEVAGHVAAAWDDDAASWRPGQQVVLFDEAARIITRGMCRWAGVPLPDTDVPRMAADLVAMVDGFATPGPRLWRARAARAGGRRGSDSW